MDDDWRQFLIPGVLVALYLVAMAYYAGNPPGRTPPPALMPRAGEPVPPRGRTEAEYDAEQLRLEQEGGYLPPAAAQH